MHRRLGNSAVPGNLLGLARLYERIINDEPPLSIQGARIGSHSVFHFFHRQMCCCTRDSCHTFPLLFSVITSFILSQYADWYDMASDVAQGLHLSTNQLVTELKSGKSLNNIATTQHVTAAQLHTIVTNAVHGALNKAVSAGDLTQAQSDSISQFLQKHPQFLDHLLNRHYGKKGTGS